MIPGLGGSPGEGNGYPLQYSSLENSMDCIVHGVTKRHDRVTFTLTHFASISVPPLSCHSAHLYCKSPNPALCAFHSYLGTIEKITQLCELVSLQIYLFNHRWTFAPLVILPTHVFLQSISDPPSHLYLDRGAD